MINFRKLTFKNILSSGNKATIINFTNGETTLIVGTNGTGKSLIYEALFFCLYGKPFRKIKKDQLINSINKKKLLVSVEIEISGKIVTIVRGIKPAIFDIFVDGEKQKSEASVKDQQSYLSQHLLKISESTFRQIVILGSTSYVPFMTLPTASRNKVINDLLDLEIYQLMLVIARKIYNVHKKELGLIEIEVKSLMGRVSDKNQQIKKLTSVIEDEGKNLDGVLNDNNKILDEYKADLAKLNDDILEIDIDGINNKRDEHVSGISDIDRKLYSLNTNITSSNQEIEFFETNDTCPTCYNEIDGDIKAEKIYEHTEDVKKSKTDMDSFKITLEDLNAGRSRLIEQINEFNELKSRIYQAKGKVENQKIICDTHEEVIEKHNSGANKTALDSMGKELSGLQSNLKENKVTGRKSVKNTKNYENVVEILKDSGLKAQIIASYLPVINKLIQNYMDILEFPVSFTFDNEFNEIIKSRGRDELSYGNFSAGERMRLDLCLLFTWRKLASIKNAAQCNLLILDEIGDSSLDGAGLRGFNKILKADKKKQCTIIISHNTENLKGIDNVIEVEKVGNFSNYKIGE